MKKRTKEKAIEESPVAYPDVWLLLTFAGWLGTASVKSYPIKPFKDFKFLKWPNARSSGIEGVPWPTPGSFTEGYRPLGITFNHWQPTAIAEKEPLPSKITTAKESEI